MFLSTVRTSQQLPSDPLYGNRRWLVLTIIMRKKHLSLFRETTRKQKQWIWYVRMIQQNKNQHLGVFVVGEMCETTAGKLSTGKILDCIFTGNIFETLEISLFAGHNSSRLWADYPAGQIQFPISWAKQPVKKQFIVSGLCLKNTNNDHDNWW